jgi:hypothetical protein
MAIVVVLAAVGLGDDGVQAEQQADAEERGRVENGVADGDGSDGGRAEATDHDGVDDALGHPAQLAEDDRYGQFCQGGQFPFPNLPRLLRHPLSLDGDGPGSQSCRTSLRFCTHYVRRRILKVDRGIGYSGRRIA